MDFIEAKICLLGDTGVGKSSIVTRFVHNTFNASNESTIGASFMTKTFIHNNTNYKLNIWDTAGQERYRALAPMYYRQALVCIVVYDVTQMDSFRSVISWIKELKNHLKEKTIIALTGNKCDLNNQRQVNTREARAYAESIGAEFIETSAKSAQNVNQLFCLIATKLPKDSHKTTTIERIHENNTLQEKSGDKCC